MKTHVYSWRLSGDLKNELERAARLRRAPLSKVLEQAARAWLAQNAAELAEDEETQQKLHAAAERCFGAITGLGPYHAERVRETVRKQLRERYGRKRAH
jgi:predicted transcriptional regulator